MAAVLTTVKLRRTKMKFKKSVFQQAGVSRTQKVGEKLRLSVVLGRHEDRVEEDKDDDEPVESLAFHQPPYLHPFTATQQQPQPELNTGHFFETQPNPKLCTQPDPTDGSYYVTRHRQSANDYQLISS